MKYQEEIINMTIETYQNKANEIAQRKAMRKSFLMMFTLVVVSVLISFAWQAGGGGVLVCP